MTQQPAELRFAFILFMCFSFCNLVAAQGDCPAVGGVLITLDTDSTEVTVCVGDEISDAVYAKVWEEEGDASIYAITDSDGVILNLLHGPKFQFEGTSVGTDFIYHISTVGNVCLLYTSPSPRDKRQSRMPSSA